MSDPYSIDFIAAPAIRTGKVIHDRRGNAVWNWAIDTDGLETESTLELMDNAIVDATVDPTVGWCGDPYNRAAARL